MQRWIAVHVTLMKDATKAKPLFKIMKDAKAYVKSKQQEAIEF